MKKAKKLPSTKRRAAALDKSTLRRVAGGLGSTAGCNGCTVSKCGQSVGPDGETITTIWAC